MPHRLTLACTVICAVLAYAPGASGQTPAADQYLDGEVALDAGVTAGPLQLAVSLSFGTAPPPRLELQISAVIAQLGRTAPLPVVSSSRAMRSFLASPLAERVSAGSQADLGRAVARLILHPSARTPAVMRALFGARAARTVPRLAIFTRSTPATGDLRGFQDGIVRGFAEIPRGYAELSDAPTSFVEDFARLGVPTVDNLDAAAGRAALVAILTTGARGNFGTKPTADAVLTPTGVQRLAARGPLIGEPASPGSPGSPALYGPLLAIVLGALAWALPVRRRRRPRPG